MFRVIMDAGSIPLGSTVTKVKGDKAYTLTDKLTVYGETGERRELKAYAGARFLVSGDGNASAVSETTDLLWYAEDWQLLEMLDISGIT